MSDHVPERLPDMLTHVDAGELAIALVRGWRALWGQTPSRASILVLLAQSALETGHWRSCHAWNLGNVKSVEGDGHDYTFFRCNEVIGGKTVWFDPPHPTCRFRAFHTLDAGALDHLIFLRTRKRYAAAWEQVILGDARAFVHALKAAGYFTADERQYSDAVASIFHTFDGKLGAFDPTAVPDDAEQLDEETRRRTMGLVAASLFRMSGELDDEEPTEPSGNA